MDRQAGRQCGGWWRCCRRWWKKKGWRCGWWGKKGGGGGGGWRAKTPRWGGRGASCGSCCGGCDARAKERCTAPAFFGRLRGRRGGPSTSSRRGVEPRSPARPPPPERHPGGAGILAVVLSGLRSGEPASPLADSAGRLTHILPQYAAVAAGRVATATALGERGGVGGGSVASARAKKATRMRARRREEARPTSESHRPAKDPGGEPALPSPSTLFFFSSFSPALSPPPLSSPPSPLPLSRHSNRCYWYSYRCGCRCAIAAGGGSWLPLQRLARQHEGGRRREGWRSQKPAGGGGGGGRREEEGWG
ncbi:hypothetical protein FaHV1S18_082 [Falconid herpesvirus 1]|uniref:Uncharacterized protein n=2 Tax=Columbid alphaherpesvirus 1 TaxID=93386 RepID=A0A068ER67_9ALPH|nr:hypothetical protein FaHV1S18_004 [Falconid herpesvirus 1]YP_009046566.1 hypothetical protein FaHV1S18_082 [Falconid herpesvirus 1]YP_009352898.1 hypothetical protein CoHVHLJ_004 [Columbid alphaherpesvirus 1]YP_009352976.1 hypothetical protein CoHVHLJ_082 [Columbid alphaherpesvirus 1]AID52694.1 hypothetical protein FaHV1S18_004 [Falconid herpesvirus 1]AID52772.1 hypothetical protein FaHV1S18_082 [Falconid herpesvirus 1]ARD71315.1 hypothetical protein CoHVHLJ_004 [Columbid alphaherpesvirus 